MTQIRGLWCKLNIADLIKVPLKKNPKCATHFLGIFRVKLAQFEILALKIIFLNGPQQFYCFPAIFYLFQQFLAELGYLGQFFKDFEM